MTLFSLLVALLIEQARPLDFQRWVAAPLARAVDGLGGGGEGTQAPGQLQWLLIVLGGALGTALVFATLWAWHPMLAFAFNIVVLYLCLGIRQERDFFNDIHAALRLGDLERARALLGEWLGGDHASAGAGDIARLTMEKALVTAHRRVFGTIFWFVILPGPSGAVLYRLACLLGEGRATPVAMAQTNVGGFAGRALCLIDWLPVRVTAAAFSVVGNFEDALYCWRAQSVLWADKASAILLASGAGAIGVRLGMPVVVSGEVIDRPEVGLGAEAGVEHLQSAVGLVSRALVVGLFLLALLSVVGWVGK